MTDLAGVEVGRAGPADAASLLSLINLVQPIVPWDERHLAWQFFEPPSGAARLWVIRAGESIVSLYSAIPQRVRAGSTTQQGWMVQDVMTHPDYRGRGFLNHLGALCLDEIRADGAVGYTFPNKASEGSFRRLRWEEAGRVPLRVATTPGHGSSGREPVVTPLASFSSVHELIWGAADVGSGVHRDAAYLGWRYGKPRQRYDRFAIGGDQGVLVLKFFETDAGSVLHVCELLVRSEARELLQPALRFVRSRALARGAARITAWLPVDHPYASAFDSAGLILDAAHDRFMFVTGPVSRDRWHVTQGDSDVY